MDSLNSSIVDLTSKPSVNGNAETTLNAALSVLASTINKSTPPVAKTGNSPTSRPPHLWPTSGTAPTTKPQSFPQSTTPSSGVTPNPITSNPFQPQNMSINAPPPPPKSPQLSFASGVVDLVSFSFDSHRLQNSDYHDRFQQHVNDCIIAQMVSDRATNLSDNPMKITGLDPYKVLNAPRSKFESQIVDENGTASDYSKYTIFHHASSSDPNNTPGSNSNTTMNGNQIHTQKTRNIVYKLFHPAFDHGIMDRKLFNYLSRKVLKLKCVGDVGIDCLNFLHSLFITLYWNDAGFKLEPTESPMLGVIKLIQSLVPLSTCVWWLNLHHSLNQINVQEQFPTLNFKNILLKQTEKNTFYSNLIKRLMASGQRQVNTWKQYIGVSRQSVSQFVDAERKRRLQQLQNEDENGQFQTLPFNQQLKHYIEQLLMPKLILKVQEMTDQLERELLMNGKINSKCLSALHSKKTMVPRFFADSDLLGIDLNFNSKNANQSSSSTASSNSIPSSISPKDQVMNHNAINITNTNIPSATTPITPMTPSPKQPQHQQQQQLLQQSLSPHQQLSSKKLSVPMNQIITSPNSSPSKGQRQMTPSIFNTISTTRSSSNLNLNVDRKSNVSSNPITSGTTSTIPVSKQSPSGKQNNIPSPAQPSILSALPQLMMNDILSKSPSRDGSRAVTPIAKTATNRTPTPSSSSSSTSSRKESKTTIGTAINPVPGYEDPVVKASLERYEMLQHQANIDRHYNMQRNGENASSPTGVKTQQRKGGIVMGKESKDLMKQLISKKVTAAEATLSENQHLQNRKLNASKLKEEGSESKVSSSNKRKRENDGGNMDDQRETKVVKSCGPPMRKRRRRIENTINSKEINITMEKREDSKDEMEEKEKSVTVPLSEREESEETVTLMENGNIQIDFGRKRVAKFLCCGICNVPLQSDIWTINECLDSFCKSCLDGYFDECLKDNTAPKCPACDESLGGGSIDSIRQRVSKEDRMKCSLVDLISRVNVNASI